jgi:hypothetical protein
MKHHALGDEGLKTHITLLTLVFLAVMAGLGALAWFTKGVKYMPPPAGSLAAPPSTNAPPPSR